MYIRIYIIKVWIVIRNGKKKSGNGGFVSHLMDENTRDPKTLGKRLGEGRGGKNKRDELQNELPSNDGNRGCTSPTRP